MNIVPILIAFAMAAIGAVLYFLDKIGFGIALIVCAAVISQTTTLSNIWWRHVYRKYNGGQSLAPRNAVADRGIVASAVSEIEEGSARTRSFLKNFKEIWRKPDAENQPPRDKNER